MDFKRRAQDARVLVNLLLTAASISVQREGVYVATNMKMSLYSSLLLLTTIMVESSKTMCHHKFVESLIPFVKSIDDFCNVLT